MSTTTWDPSDTGGWRLSNGNLTATSPDNNTKGAISVGYANTPIPDHAKTYYEFKVSGAAIQTAFTVGFGVHGFDPSNKNIHDIGAHVANATFLGFAYNLTETNSGNVVYDPQGNWNYAATHPGALAAPNRWPDGSVIGVMVDRIDNTAQFTLNGILQGPPIDISGMAGKTLYPFVELMVQIRPGRHDQRRRQWLRGEGSGRVHRAGRNEHKWRRHGPRRDCQWQCASTPQSLVHRRID